MTNDELQNKMVNMSLEELVAYATRPCRCQSCEMVSDEEFELECYVKENLVEEIQRRLDNEYETERSNGVLDDWRESNLR